MHSRPPAKVHKPDPIFEKPASRPLDLKSLRRVGALPDMVGQRSICERLERE
jgi:hypothetical protein